MATLSKIKLFLNQKLFTFVNDFNPDFLKELGKWFLDVAKYVATVIILSVAFSSISSKAVAGLVGAAVIIVCVLTAYTIYCKIK